MSALADQIGAHPVVLALLDRLELQRQQLGASKPAANQHLASLSNLHKEIVSGAGRG
jgi:hypothetical protein